MNAPSNRVILIAGAGAGLGVPLVRKLSADATCLVVDSERARLDDLVSALDTAGLDMIASELVPAFDEAGCQTLVASVIERFSRIDGLVLAMGIEAGAGRRKGPVHELEIADYDASFGPVLREAFFLMKAVLRPLVAARRGDVIQLCAASAWTGGPYDGLVNAFRAGLVGLSDAAAEEVRPFGVRVQMVGAEPPATPEMAEAVAAAVSYCLSLPPGALSRPVMVEALRPPTARRGAGRKGAPRQDAAPAAAPDSPPNRP